MKYTIEKSRFGLYTAVDEQGNKHTTGLTEEAVDYVMRNIRIPVLQGTFDGYTSTPRKGVVDGKL